MSTAAKLGYQGIDYLRLTYRNDQPYDRWASLMEPEFCEEDEAGRRPHYRWLLGYYGRVGEHCFVGKGDQGAMVQASGSLADNLFYPLSEAGGKCTRIDLQVTATAPDSVDEYLHAAFVCMSTHERSRGRPAAVEIQDTNYGAKMVTLGSRQSQVYGRIYDKGRESHEKCYDGMVRHELEVKAETAQNMHCWLREDKTRMHTIHSVVGQYFETRGCPMFWDQYELTDAPPAAKRTKNDQTKIAWLNTQVAPTFQDLLRRGKGELVMEALLTGADDALILALDDALSAVKDRR